MARTVLGSAPSMPALFAKAALTARGRGGDLPDTRLARTGVPVDVAETIAWLSQPSAAGVNGQVVRVCGQSFLGA